MRAVPGQDGVATESCAVRVSGQVDPQAQEAVVTLPAKLKVLIELIELMDLTQLDQPAKHAGLKQLPWPADQKRPQHRRHNPVGDGLLG